jgi:hypothetical protein
MGIVACTCLTNVERPADSFGYSQHIWQGHLPFGNDVGAIRLRAATV